MMIKIHVSIVLVQNIITLPPEFIAAMDFFCYKCFSENNDPDEIINKFQVFAAIPISIHQYELDFTHQVYINNTTPKTLIELDCEQVSNNILYNCKQKYYDHKCNAAISDSKF